MTSFAATPAGVGGLLREWRQRRRLSQLDLASEAEVSTRHLSFVETGRAAPSRDMLLRLAERLDVPLRARNELLHAGGFAAIYAERPLDAPEMTVARRRGQSVGCHADNAKGERVRNTASRAALNAGPVDLAVHG